MRLGIDAELSQCDNFVGVTYRGLNRRLPSYLYATGAVITWNALSSSSSDVKTARSFIGAATPPVGTLFLILCNTGRCISHLSDFPEEKEVLFPAGTQFRVGTPVSVQTRHLLQGALRCDLEQVWLCSVSKLRQEQCRPIDE